MGYFNNVIGDLEFDLFDFSGKIKKCDQNVFTILYLQPTAQETARILDLNYRTVFLSSSY